MGNEYCRHVYEEVDSDPCPFCGKPSHRTDWTKQHELHRDWIASGKATLQGWWSI